MFLEYLVLTLSMELSANSVGARDQLLLSKLVSLPGSDAVRQRRRVWLLDISKMAFQVYVPNRWIICNRLVLISAECIPNESEIQSVLSMCTSGLHFLARLLSFSFYSSVMGSRRELLLA